jgi:hypothetical protein
LFTDPIVNIAAFPGLSSPLSIRRFAGAMASLTNSRPRKPLPNAR